MENVSSTFVYPLFSVQGKQLSTSNIHQSSTSFLGNNISRTVHWNKKLIEYSSTPNHIIQLSVRIIILLWKKNIMVNT